MDGSGTVTEWPEGSVSPETSFGWHLDELARWLRGAGAEGRFFLAYVSGPRARAELLDGLRARQVDVVHTPASPGAPIHDRLASHRGDHFNDKLHVVDGLEEGDAERTLRELGLQIATLRRTATWACVLVESPQALLALEQAGGIVRRHASRRVCLLSSEDPRPTEPLDPGAALVRWRAEHRVAEVNYWIAMAPDFVPDALELGRYLRSGWSGVQVKASAHPATSALLGWASGRLVPGELPDALLDLSNVAEVMLSHPSSGLDPRRRARSEAALRDRPVARWNLGLDLPDTPDLARLPSPARALVGAGVRLPHTTRAALLDRLDAGPNLRASVSYASAQLAAGEDDLDGCDVELAEADALLSAAALEAEPELHFEIVAKRIELDRFLSRTSDARAGLDRLDELLVRLGSPYWRARALLVRARFAAELDPRKAAEHARAAAALFAAFGWPTWRVECEAPL